jgi:hypothetical protein
MTQEDYIKWKQAQMVEEDESQQQKHEAQLWHLQQRMEVMSAVLQGVGLGALMKMCHAVQCQLQSMVPRSGRIDDLPDGVRKSYAEMEGELMVVKEAVRIAGGWREAIPAGGTGAEESYAFGLDLELWPVNDRVEILSLQVSRLQQALLRQKIVGKWRNAKDNIMASFRKTTTVNTAPFPLAMKAATAAAKTVPAPVPVLPVPKPQEGAMVADAKLVAVVLQLNHRVAMLADAIAPLVQRWAYVRLRANMLSAMSVNELIEWRGDGGGNGGGGGGRGGGQDMGSAPAGEMYDLKELFRQKNAGDAARRRTVDPSVIRRAEQTKGRQRGVTPWLQMAGRDQLEEGSVDSGGSAYGGHTFPPPDSTNSSTLFSRRSLGENGGRYHIGKVTEVRDNRGAVGSANGGQCPVAADLRQKKDVLGWRRMQLRKALTMARQQLQRSQWASVDTPAPLESVEEHAQRAVARVADAIASGEMYKSEGVGGGGGTDGSGVQQWRSLLSHRAPLTSIGAARLLLVYGKDTVRAAKAAKSAKKKGKKPKKAHRLNLASHVGRARQLGMGVDRMGSVGGVGGGVGCVVGGADDPDGAVLRYGNLYGGSTGAAGGGTKDGNGVQTESSALRHIVDDMDRVVEEIRGCLVRSVGDHDPVGMDMATIVPPSDEQAADGFEGDEEEEDEKERAKFTGTGEHDNGQAAKEGVARDGMLMDMLTLLNICGDDGTVHSAAHSAAHTSVGSPDRQAVTRAAGRGEDQSHLYWRGGRGNRQHTGGWAGGAVGGDNSQFTYGGSNPALGQLPNPEIEAAAADAARGGSGLHGSYPPADAWSAAAASRARGGSRPGASAWGQ